MDTLMSGVRRMWRGLWSALAVITRPVRRNRGLEGVVIQPYRGYGTAERVHLTGRIFRQLRWGAGLRAGSVARRLADALRRFLRWGLGSVELTARLGGGETTVVTDRDGYFRVDLRPESLPDPERLWHEVDLVARFRGTTARSTGEVFVPPPSARFVVISDIDDTVMETGVANKARMMWRLFMTSAESRVAFEGVGDLYRALHAGTGGNEQNPVLYVSRAPWSIYEVLERFFRIHDIPVGPILFLREWGLTLQRPLPRRAREHKRERVREMLERYPELPFILVGDSGQHDPEVYARVVQENPERVLAVYIRDVGADEGRRREIEGLARVMEEAGSPLVLAEDSGVMAEHAARRGWIAEAAVSAP